MKRNFLLMLLFLSLYSKAQHPDSVKFSLNFVPQYLFINGIRGDIEYKVNNEISLYLGGQKYFGNINQDGNETVALNSSSTTADQSQRLNDELNGAGINLGIKYYFVENNEERFYLGAEFIRNKFDFVINDYGYFELIDDGLRFYEYKLGKLDYTIDQNAYNLLTGVTVTKKRLIINAWAGMTFSDASYDKSLLLKRKFDNNVSSYAYKGWSPIFGFKMGILIF